MDDPNGIDGDEYIVPLNLKPPSLTSKKKIQETSNPQIVKPREENYYASENNLRSDLGYNRSGVNYSGENEYRSHLETPDTYSPSRSPVDKTPIIINGAEISRDDFTPIQDEFNQFESQRSIPERLGRDQDDGLVSSTAIQKPNSYKKFNPPFPSVASYIQNVESTDASVSPNTTNPKITSPSSDISIDPRPLPSNGQRAKLLQLTDRNPPSPLKNIPPSPDKSKQDRFANQESTPKLASPYVPVVSSSLPGPPPTSTIPDKRDTRSQANYNSDEKQSKPPPEPAPKPLTEEELISRAQDYFLKYQVLQKSWPEYRFPNMDDKWVQQKPQLVIDTYTTSIERIQVDMDVSQYKIALIIMFLVIEVVSVKFLGFDAGGYTLSQIKAMNRYEKLLIEIGERKLLAGGDSWPPEVKILFIGLFNCALFILMKYLSSILGPQLISYISPIVNGLFSGVIDNSKTAALPDEIPQRQQDISGMLGNVASMAANAFTNNNSVNAAPNKNTQTKASRRPVYRE
jgi:hypothetical protein